MLSLYSNINPILSVLDLETAKQPYWLPCQIRLAPFQCIAVQFTLAFSGKAVTKCLDGADELLCPMPKEVIPGHKSTKSIARLLQIGLTVAHGENHREEDSAEDFEIGMESTPSVSERGEHLFRYAYQCR